MELKSLNLNRYSYQNDGKLTGTLHVTSNEGSEIKIVLTEDKADKILALISEQLVESAKEIAENLTREIIEHRPALEDKSG